MLFECKEVKPIWNTLGTATGHPFTQAEVMHMRFAKRVSNRDARIVLTSSANTAIWKQRNGIKFGNAQNFDAAGTLHHILAKMTKEYKFENQRRRPREPFRTAMQNTVEEIDTILRLPRFLATGVT